MAEETRKRKVDHIRICLNDKSQAKKATSGFEDIQLVHRALPEINKGKINLSTTFLGKKLQAPIIVGAMTGGAEEVTSINAAIAEAVEELGLGMGLGSQRAAIENPKLDRTYRVAREKAPNAFIVANVGGVQLIHGYGPKEVKRIVEMIDADAVAIHLNALQEAVQPEGQTDFKGVLSKIAEIVGTIKTPVIVKETGVGICAEDAKALENAGVKAIDVAGVGGTSFAAVEKFRANKKKEPYGSLGQTFWDWGIPTAVSLIEVIQSVKIPVITSGGIRTGVDIAKALTLNASLASMSQPILKAAAIGPKETKQKLTALIEELRNALFLVGVERVNDLIKIPVVITGKSAEWLKTRGFDIQKYAQRGQ